MAKFEEQLHCQKHFFLLDTSSCTCLLFLYCMWKYQRASVKALIQVNSLINALSKHKHNPYLIGKRKKWPSSQSYLFVKTSYFAIKLLRTNVQCVYSHPAGDVTSVSVMPRKVTVKIGDAENRCRWCRDKNQWKWAKILLRLVLSRVPFRSRFAVILKTRS